MVAFPFFTPLYVLDVPYMLCVWGCGNVHISYRFPSHSGYLYANAREYRRSGCSMLERMREDTVSVSG